MWSLPARRRAPHDGRVARELPEGTVSMLFSDIEGSTLLLSHLGPAYLDALDLHRRVMRRAWADHGGTEMGTEGDSFFVVFSTGTAAVAAAVQAQRGLAEQDWPGGGTVRVRMGIHTGAPQVHEGDYWGMDVHRAARIAATAHGGQVVVSAPVAQLAGGDLPDGVALRHLGIHHLKDIAEPEPLFQLVVEGLVADFPPLRSLGTASSLPSPPTPIVGRDVETAGLLRLLGDPVTRLVTLEGPGGSGKTRLAVEVGRRATEELLARVPGGVYFVPLAAVTTAEVMWTSIAEVLDVPARERTPERVLDALAQRRLLLVLDNLEQVEGADEVVQRLLDAAPGVLVLTTTRHPLGLVAETRYAVAPLALPTEAGRAAAEAAGAVRLFVDRATSVHPGFRLTEANLPDVVAICRRLDGLPLAIELCASRVRLLAPRALLSRLDQALDQALDIAATSRLVPRRQRTLRDTIGWSYDLLQPDRAGFFRRLGVFAGGADLDAVAAVLPPDERSDALELVGDLVDANLAGVTEGPDGEPRVVLLATIRAFACDQLAANGELDEVRRAHADHFAELVERLRVLRESRHLAALDAAETELENLREALGWALAADVATALRLAASLDWVWQAGGYFAEGRGWYERVLDRAPDVPSSRLAACLSGYANVLLSQGEAGRARDAAERALTVARSLDDAAALGYALGVLGTAQLQLGELEAARATLQESLPGLRAAGDRSRLGRHLGHLGGIEEELGHLDEAEALIRQSLAVFEELDDVHEAAIQRQNLVHLLAVAGRVNEAIALARGLVDTIVGLHSPNLTMAFANTWMNILLRCGDPVGAARLFGAEQAMRERLQTPNPWEDEERDEALALLDGTFSPADWERERLVGHDRLVEDLLAQLARG
jgi:predicted ATPase/class 3 adenylate cyclase